MAATDRAFRALGRDEPETLVSLVRILAPDLLPPSLASSAGFLVSMDPRLDLPDPSREVDLALAERDGPLLWHLEGQGYKDDSFLDRVFFYHLGLVLRHREREVRTVALWLRTPSEAERQPLLRKGSLSLLVTHLVLPEARASRLVLDERTACFAPAGDDEGRGDWVVCQQTVAVLQQSGASLRRWQMAAVAARSRSKERYRAMVRVMEEAGVRSVIIEDLIHIGEELGFEKGVEQGFDKGLLQGRTEAARGAVHRVLARRGLPLTEAQQARLAAEGERATLERWLDQAITAASVDEALR